jgi:hypothetical protein
VATYSFIDNLCSISGPNGAFSLGSGAGNAEGGITVTMVEDKSTMTIGADGQVMHSLHAGKGGNVTVRLLKTAPANAQLSEMYARDTTQSQNHGLNTISIRDMARNDVIVCQQCAFAKFPDETYAKEGGEMSWMFHAGVIDFKLGSGTAQPTGIIAAAA